MKILLKIPVLLSAIYMFSFGSISSAHTISVHFNHVNSEKPGQKQVFMCPNISKFGHQTGMACSNSKHLFANLATVLGVPLGSTYSGYVTTGLGLLYGKYDLQLICRDGGAEKGLSHAFYISESDKDLRIDVSCPIAENGDLLQPSYTVHRNQG